VLACCAGLSGACTNAGGDNGASDGGTSEAGTDTGPGDTGAASRDGALDAPASQFDSGVLDAAGVDGGNGDEAAAPVVVYATGVTVSTLAGSGAHGDVDGPSATFANPTGIALFGSGVIVVENDTGAIRTVSASGDTKTIGSSPVDQAQTSPFTIVSAPSGYYYSTDFDQCGLHVDGGGGVWSFVPDDAGAGTSSLVAGGLYVPRTLVPLPGGDIFVFDTATPTWAPVTEQIAERLVPAGGAISSIAGHRGQVGFANGVGGAALFGSPTIGGVLLLDGSGVVVADCGNHQLRLVALDGTVSTYAGSTTAGWHDGPVGSALFSCPHALAIDSVGDIYVSDGFNNAIRRLSSSGNVTTVAGDGTQGYADGPGNVAEFYGAEGMVVSSDGTTLFVADGTLGNAGAAYNRIRKVTLPALGGD